MHNSTPPFPPSKDVCITGVRKNGYASVTSPGECDRTAPGCGEDGAAGGNSGGGGGGSGGLAAPKPTTPTPMIDPYTTPSPIKMTCDSSDLPVCSSKLNRYQINSEPVQIPRTGTVRIWPALAFESAKQKEKQL